MGRSPCCSKVGLNKGTWTALEDRILTSYINAHGEGNWRSLPKRAGLRRCGKSCRLRWLNYLRPDIKRGNISEDEEELIMRLHKLLGNRWSLIAGRLPGRTDNEIKNYWNTILKKRSDSSHVSPLPPYQESLPNESSVLQATLAQNQSRPSCESSNRPSATVTRPQVFRAKPARCSGPMYPLPCHTCHNNQVIMNTFCQDFDITIDDHQCHQEDKYAYEMSFFNFGTNYSEGSLNNDNSIDGKGDGVHENTNKVSLVMDEELTVENWGLHANSDVVGVEEKDPLDLDPLALFLHADEWP